MNLENCKYFTLRWSDATLDSAKKQCSEYFTDGDELKNRQSFSVRFTAL